MRNTGLPLLVFLLSACLPFGAPPDASLSSPATALDTATLRAESPTEDSQAAIQEMPSSSQSPTSGSADSLPLRCLTPVSPGDQLLVNFSDANIGTGYCLRYPGSFYVSYTQNVGRGIHGPSLHPNENLFGGTVIQPLGPAIGNSLDEAADARFPQAATREEVEIGGSVGLLLSGFPEDVHMRAALVIYENLVYEFNNHEITGSSDEARAQASAAWENVLASFAFLPPSIAEAYSACPPAQLNTSVSYTAWYVPYLNVEEGYCLLFPQDHVLHYDAARRWLLIQKPDPGFNHDPGAVTLSIMGDQPSGGLALEALVNEVIEQQARGEVYRISSLIAGQEGIFVDGLYSEAGVRHIFFLYGQVFYRIVASPTLVEERAADMEDLFRIVTSSLVFLE